MTCVESVDTRSTNWSSPGAHQASPPRSRNAFSSSSGTPKAHRLTPVRRVSGR